ncbi:MAG: tRNA pseudouridine(55) synthase TruB [Schleiferiaceae bacterium]|nr:tRNA pseudouridine(55) synthase TruB [Schleiferiaceae bacterium]MDP4758520.1 tRNA pseudouridine(55) synthase TruB [Schleiferiaceae bacterium]MDP4767522.1 tRNA pseudouridine(55) synthase TruB [Schleiferiaceae bacterium]MDP4877143.1 tRNA pseudouridine(55) synthase TruB [Schleiferiaceae bacterium]MDP4958632.1 tRNA pseudouridine(55) synthase TruB [Schleiferiaceae bacterium]
MTKASILAGEVLLVDKPLEWTSFQAVAKIRFTLQKELGLKKLKVGHAGTLDPLATGLLIICVGKKTKEIASFMGQEKEYIAEITFGGTTPSYDLESEIDATYPTEHITAAAITEILPQFQGEIQQYPPIFSAIKQGGVRMYEKARAGEEVIVEPRTVQIDELEILSFSDHVLKLRVLCGKGTYIRSLAHDLGKALHSGAHLSALRRTKIGSFTADGAKNPMEWSAYFKSSLEG